MKRILFPRTRSDLVSSGFAIVVFCGLTCPMLLQIIVLVQIDRMLYYNTSTYGTAVIVVTTISLISALCACIGFERINKGIP